jgi:uncharacterized phage protein (TIGR02220 family)
MTFLVLRKSDIEKQGLLKAAILFYLREKRNEADIKGKKFFSVKLNEISKNLGIKRRKLKSTLTELCEEKLIKMKTEKSAFLLEVRFSILCNENGQNLEVQNDIYTATKPLKPDGVSYIHSAASSRAFCTSTAHKHSAASIYSIINKLIILKEESEKTKNDKNSNLEFVRKKIGALVYSSDLPNPGSDIASPPPLLGQKAPDSPTKSETGIKGREGKPSPQIKAIMAQEIIHYLNEKTGKKFKVGASSNTKNIVARLNENYTLSDFKKIIDLKTAQWKNTIFTNGTPGINYLRPATLFSAKNFENYLNEKKGTSLDDDLENFFKRQGCKPS